METKKLIIPTMDFGVTPVEKIQSSDPQRFSIDLYDNNPERILEYTKYGTWEQKSGKLMLENHIELLGRAIKINFKDLFSEV